MRRCRSAPVAKPPASLRAQEAAIAGCAGDFPEAFQQGGNVVRQARGLASDPADAQGFHAVTCGTPLVLCCQPKPALVAAPRLGLVAEAVQGMTLRKIAVEDPDSQHLEDETLRVDFERKAGGPASWWPRGRSLQPAGIRFCRASCSSWKAGPSAIPVRHGRGIRAGRGTLSRPCRPAPEPCCVSPSHEQYQLARRVRQVDRRNNLPRVHQTR